MEEIFELDISKGWVLHRGERIDPFDVVDALQGRNAKLYMHDLDCRQRYRPQLDLIQDMSYEIPIWYDGAFRFAEWIIDPLVSGAEMVALRMPYMKNVDEYRRVIDISDRALIDASSEHPDGITDYSGALRSSQNILRLSDLGFEFYIWPAEDLKLFSAWPAVHPKVWVRGNVSGEVPQGMAVMGILKSIDELFATDEQ